jgi:chromosome segregation ATPase
MADLEQKISKLEDNIHVIDTKLTEIKTDVPYIKQDVQDLWSAVNPIIRDHEELKTEIIRYLNRIELFDKDVVSVKETVKAHVVKISEFDEQYKFLANARKNINTIFVAIIIQTIFLISGLLAFVFTLTQQKTNQQQQQQQPQDLPKKGTPSVTVGGGN